MSSFKNNIQCLNCGFNGHGYKKCTKPINSYGIIVIKKYKQLIKYLLIQRKFSYGLIEFMTCKFVNENIINFYKLCQIIINLPLSERIMIESYSFDYIWHKIWQWKVVEEDKYNEYKQIFNYIKDECIGYLFFNIDYKYEYPPWEFPKGKKNIKETDLQCAIRECNEETTLTEHDYYIFPNLQLFKDKYIGTDMKQYCNNYFIGELINTHKLIYYKWNNDIMNNEIKKIGWFTYDKIIQLYKR